LAEAGLLRLPEKSLPESFWRMPSPRISFVDADEEEHECRSTDDVARPASESLKPPPRPPPCRVIPLGRLRTINNKIADRLSLLREE